jgi:hypothetical protein
MQTDINTRRTERERIERVWTIGLIRTFAEVVIIGIVTGVAFLVMVLGIIYGW